MKMSRFLPLAGLTLAALAGTSWAAAPDSGATLSDLVDVQKYSRAIHIMAMLMVGFGFLMVFVKRYGRSAVTATYLLVSLAIPLYFLKDKQGLFGGPSVDIDSLILAEFAAASLLICAGAVLGRLKMETIPPPGTALHPLLFLLRMDPAPWRAGTDPGRPRCRYRRLDCDSCLRRPVPAWPPCSR